MVTPSSNKYIPRKTAFLIVLLCSLFGANAVAIKATLTGVGIFTSAAIRFGGAACFLICYARLTNHSLRVSRDQLLQLFFLTVIFFLKVSIVIHIEYIPMTTMEFNLLRSQVHNDPGI